MVFAEPRTKLSVSMYEFTNHLPGGKMKNIISWTSFFVVVIFLTLPLKAKVNSASPAQISESAIVDNLLLGVNSGNEGLKLSALFYLGNYDSEKSLIELLRTLKDDPRDEARITAALSLFKLGDVRGIFAIERAAIFDESPRVRKLCEKFYTQFSATHF